MNRTNRTSDFRLSGVKAGVRALPDHRATNIRGGMGHKSALICYTTHFSILLYHRRLSTTTRPDRADTEENGMTEATPPFLPLYRQTWRGFGAGFVTGFGAYPAPSYGVASVQFIPAGRLRTRTPSGRLCAIDKPHEKALSDPDNWRAWLFRLGFPLPAFPLARRQSNARPGALSHPQLLRLGGPLILRRARCRSPDRRAVFHHNLAGLV